MDCILKTVMVNEDANSNITPRELEVAKLMCYGFTNEEIGGKLSISPKTVKIHTNNLYNKLELTDIEKSNYRVQLVLSFLKVGLVKLEDIEPKVKLNLV